MVIASDGQKSNLGLSLKFEAKSMKVLDYSQKATNGRGWEYSEQAIRLIEDYKVCIQRWFLLNYNPHRFSRKTILPCSQNWTFEAIV